MPGRFDNQYQCFPVSFAGKEELENGNKIILPSSALEHLARLNISYPMLFEIRNPARGGHKSHGGVQEFSAEEGTCFLPYWLMQNLLLSEGDLVRVCNTSLPKGKFVKLQPHASDFLEIHNPRAVLENTLRNFATLTVGDNIVINYNNKRHEIEIIEAKPANAICIIEADVNVDFAPPKDYREPPPVARAGAQTGAGGFKAKVEEEAQEPEEPEEPKSALFSGAGNRVDGKAIKVSQSPALGPSAAPKVDEFADMPWKKRLIKGVKHTEPPPLYGIGHMTSKAGVDRNKAAPTQQHKSAFEGSGNTLM